MFYLLDENKQPYKVELEESYKLYEDMDMKVTARDQVNEVVISTVFLGMDHSLPFDKDGNPIENPTPVLWETMIFNGELNYYQERYTSHEDALVGHQRAIDLVKSEHAV